MAAQGYSMVRQKTFGSTPYEMWSLTSQATRERFFAVVVRTLNRDSLFRISDVVAFGRRFKVASAVILRAGDDVEIVSPEEALAAVSDRLRTQLTRRITRAEVTTQTTDELPAAEIEKDLALLEQEIADIEEEIRGAP
nr:hypothetical protein GCM10023233_19440 [Brevibacterium otitidis]